MAIFTIAWSAGASAQERGSGSKAAPCEVCITRAEFEQSEKDAAKADRFDELQGNYNTCNAERHEARGAAKTDGRRADKCLAARMDDAAERGKLEKDRDDKSRQRWIFGAGGFVAGLLVALGLASAF